MAPGFLHRISDDPNMEKRIEKQMGCMAGFLQMFDRPNILAGKRLYSTKRLATASTKPTETTTESTGDFLADGASVAPPSPAGNIGSPAFIPEDARAIPVICWEQQQQQQQQSRSSLDIRDKTESFSKESTVNNVPTKSSSRLGIGNLMPEILQAPATMFEFKDPFRSSMKLREAPRLSLDSRAVLDKKGSLLPREIRTSFVVPFSSNPNGRSSLESLEENEDGETQRRSPSVVARLMGLEALPDPSQDRKSSPELRRSASESRANRDLFPYKFIDGNSFQFNSGDSSGNAELTSKKNTIEEERSSKLSKLDVKTKKQMKKSSNEGGLDWNLQQKKKSFDTQDFFPEPKRTGMIYGEIERRLKMRGIDEPAKDLETLKQILEALQLKGLLLPRKSEEKNGHRNLVYDRLSPVNLPESPIVIMRPTSYFKKKLPVAGNWNARSEDELNSRFREGNSRSPVTRELASRNLRTEILRPVRAIRDRPECERTERRIRNRLSTPESNNASGIKSSSSPSRRRPPVNLETQRKGKDSSERRNFPCQSPKSVSPRKVGSESPIKSPRNKKQTNETSKKDRNSAPTELQRSLKLDMEGRNLLDRCDKLIHNIAEITVQPCPVSVLDSFYSDDTSTSSTMNMSIKEDESNWNAGIVPILTKPEPSSPGLMGEYAADGDFVYVSEILQNSEAFSPLKTRGKTSSLHIKLVFDTVTEILQYKKQQFFSKRNVFSGKQMLSEVWTEFRRIREPIPAEDICDVVCGILHKDMCLGSVGWNDQSVEISETVLDIERLIFKDLIAEMIREPEMIRELADVAGKWRAPRRQLIFE